MRYFFDTRCRTEKMEYFEWEGDAEPTKCLICGLEGKVGEDIFELPPVRLVFTDKNGIQVFIHKSEVIGRDTLRLFEDYKYVANEQFKLNKDKEKGWSVEGLDNTTNPTYLNGEKLEIGKVVDIDYKKYNEILIGNIESGAGLKLKITFE